MKIRKGFVSNSSTSSFVLLGATIEELNMMDVVRAISPAEAERIASKDYPEDEAHDWLLTSAGGGWAYHSEEGYFGIDLGSSYNEETNEVPLSLLEDYIGEVKRVFEKLSISKPIKLMSGTRCS